MTYETARACAAQISRSGSVLGLKSIKNLMHELSDVQEKQKIIHIAGTNGKGSAGAFIECALMEAGCKVGRYTSPAVFEPLEVFRVNGNNISREDYAAMFSLVKNACDRMVKKGMEHPTIFEVETALAFLYFEKEKCDYVLLEAGMGGRTDATNLIKHPVCSVLTSISMDHMQFLGKTLEEIAYAKVGIIKEGCPVVTAEQKPEAMQVIKTEAARRHAEVHVSDMSKIEIKEMSLEKLLFFYPGMGNVVLHLTGTYQIENAALAATALREVLKISDEHILSGLKKTVWHGRFEVIGRNPLFLIDGAHNEDAAVKLRASLENYFTNIPITYIIGMFADKEHEKVLKIMLPLASRVYTVTPDNPRAMQAETLAEEAEQIGADAAACSSVRQAAALAEENARREGGIVIAFGSLSYLKEITQYKKRKQ